MITPPSRFKSMMMSSRGASTGTRWTSGPYFAVTPGILLGVQFRVQPDNQGTVLEKFDGF